MTKAFVAPAVHFKGSGWAKKDRFDGPRRPRRRTTARPPRATRREVDRRLRERQRVGLRLDRDGRRRRTESRTRDSRDRATRRDTSSTSSLRHVLQLVRLRRPMAGAATDWITLAEASEILAAANIEFRPATIGGWARAGKLQSIKLGGTAGSSGVARSAHSWPRRGGSAPRSSSRRCSRTSDADRRAARSDDTAGLGGAPPEARPADLRQRPRRQGPGGDRPLQRARRRPARGRDRLQHALRAHPAWPCSAARCSGSSSPIRHGSTKVRDGAHRLGAAARGRRSTRSSADSRRRRRRFRSSAWSGWSGGRRGCSRSLEMGIGAMFAGAPQRGLVVRTVRRVASIAGRRQSSSWRSSCRPRSLRSCSEHFGRRWRGHAARSLMSSCCCGLPLVLSTLACRVRLPVPAARPTWAVCNPRVHPSTIGFGLVVITRLFAILAPLALGANFVYGTLGAIFVALAWLGLTYTIVLIGAAWVSERMLAAEETASVA